MAVVVFALVLCVRMEWQRFQVGQVSGMPLLAYLTFWNLESTLPMVMLAGLLFCWKFAAAKHSSAHKKKIGPSDVPVGRKMIFCVAVFLVSLGSSRFIGSTKIPISRFGGEKAVSFAELPPTYHDEFSYLLQARTFLDGRLSYPAAHVRPDLFHQMHVLNQRRTMSRYFPATGIWMAPFLAIGEPILGHWLAGAIAATFFYLSLIRIVSPSTAVATALMIALSPGMAVFSNLLLAHHPTLMALSVFMYCFIRMDESQQLNWAFAAGISLTFAMLGRPMTAAGFALPFGMRLLKQMVGEPATRKLAIGFAAPLCVGFAGLGVLNYEATGQVTKSAYQTYTDQFTPRHKYGFNNAIDTPNLNVPPAIQAYDEWATNLTPRVAVENVWSRVRASLQWTLGTMPLLLGMLLAVPMLLAGSRENQSQNSNDYLRLVAWAVVTLHLVHIPYWFDGIMHWHYVFETAPLLLILAAAGLAEARKILSDRIGIIGKIWVVAFVLCCLIPAWIKLPMFDNTSMISAAIGEQSFSKLQFARFEKIVSSNDVVKPALILVDERGTDPQLSFIINPPDYDADVLVCRRPESDEEIQQLDNQFENRALYVFSPKSFELKKWQLDSNDSRN